MTILRTVSADEDLDSSRHLGASVPSQLVVLTVVFSAILAIEGDLVAEESRGARLGYSFLEGFEHHHKT